MKTIFVVLFFALSTFADPLTRTGNFLGSAQPRQETPQEIAQRQAQWEAMRQVGITRELNGHALRKIDGKIHNLRIEGESKSGKIYSQSDDGILVIQMDNRDMTYWALKNYPDGITGRNISIRVIKVGKYKWWNDSQLELFDCGTLLTPEEEKQKQDEFEAAQKKIQQDRIEVMQLKSFIANSNAVASLKTEAANGSPSAQYNLALHYLNGRGCETNKDLAIHWLKTASDGGDFLASNKLVTLQGLK